MELTLHMMQKMNLRHQMTYNSSRKENDRSQESRIGETIIDTQEEYN